MPNGNKRGQTVKQDAPTMISSMKSLSMNDQPSRTMRWTSTTHLVQLQETGSVVKQYQMMKIFQSRISGSGLFQRKRQRSLLVVDNDKQATLPRHRPSKKTRLAKWRPDRRFLPIN